MAIRNAPQNKMVEGPQRPDAETQQPERPDDLSQLLTRRHAPVSTKPDNLLAKRLGEAK